MKILHGYWLSIVLFVMAIITYFLAQGNPENVNLEQWHILTRNAFFAMLLVYMARKIELPKIPVQDMIMKGLGLSNDSENPKPVDDLMFGLSLIALALIYLGIFYVIGTVLVRGV